MNTKVKLISAIIAIILQPTSAFAADDKTDKDIEVLTVIGKHAHYKTDEAHAAMRSNVSLLNTPQAVTVIPVEVMDDQLVVTLGEALKNDASVSIGRVTTDRERFSLRGFTLEESTNLLKNGHQHFSKYRLPMALIDNVEVLKGPSSLLYGQSTPGGLVNLVTKKPTYDPFAELSVKGDENGSLRMGLDVGGSVNEKKTIRYRAIVEKEDNKNWREYQDGSAQESDFLVGSLMTDIDLSEDLTLSFHFDSSDEVAGQDSGALVAANGNVIGGDKLIWDMPWTKIDAQSQNYGADISYQLTDNWQIDAGYNNQHNERERWESKPQTQDDFDPETGIYENKPYDKLEDWKQQAFYFDFVGSVELAGMSHDLLAGGNYLKHEYSSLKVKGDKQQANLKDGNIILHQALDYADAKAKDESYKYYGIFTQDLITMNDQWQALLGIRFDKQEKIDADNSSILPKFGLIYHPSESASIYANYSESFEPQGDVTNDEDANFGLELDPVKGIMVEVGAKWELFSGKLRFNAAAFDIKRKNIVLEVNLENNPDFEMITTQGGIQRHKGIELGVIGEINEDVSLITSAMYLDAKYDAHNEYQGNHPEDVPQLTASTWLKYSISEDVALNFGAFYEDDRYADAKNSLVKSGYIRFDAGLSYAVPLAGNDLLVRLNVENLFDKDYLAGGENGEINVGKPRTVKFGLGYTF
ncbi:TonB-dependent siderophore receptor [Pseudoalteromonas sp. NBT06-2]|uniref:TonB-dependent siderophore receptor n=1 Tax=Pseudoalteromonas sp. NBT06-2 TaxID=2025950 RepID=UPI000BA785D3|nr:TonB-dependent siderophore receptor [Pseudoalteromonas sp. NBT06-2]PAJ72233.1 TonB-dependent siderophore receptor [Pseudoalteromonas sp. NBT06-2]